MTGKLGSAPPQRGYTEAAKRTQGQQDVSGRGAPDEARSFTREREDDFGGGAAGLAGSYGPGAPEMHEEAAADAPRVAEGDARERSRQSMYQEGDVPPDEEEDGARRG